MGHDRTTLVKPNFIRACKRLHEAQDDLWLHSSGPSQAKDARAITERLACIFGIRPEGQKRSGSGPIPQDRVYAYTEGGVSVLSVCRFTVTLRLDEPLPPDHELHPMIPLMPLELAEDGCSPRNPHAPREVSGNAPEHRPRHSRPGPATTLLRRLCGE